MSKLHIILLSILAAVILLLLYLTNTSSLLKTQIPSDYEGSIVVCSHITCAETTTGGVSTNCRRTIVRCNSPSCNAGPCLTSTPSIPQATSKLIPVSSLTPVVSTPPRPSSSLIPVNPSPSAVTIETVDDELALWQELGIIAVSLLRHVSQAVVTLVSQI